MSGEQDIRPTLAEQIKALRDRLNELERRVSGDDIPLDLSDINDVRVDSLGDATITLVDGMALVYRASDELWVPGVTAGVSTPTDWVEWFVDGTQTGLAAGATLIDVNWDDSSSSGLTHGAAIILNASENAEVTEDGWYALDFYVRVDTGGVTDPWGAAELRTNITRSFAIGGDAQDTVIDVQTVFPATLGTNYFANLSLSWTGYLMSGDTATIKVRFQRDGAGADTWEISDGQFRMEKLPM